MDIGEAFKHFMESFEFKDIARIKNSKGGKYRLYKSRFLRADLDIAAMIWVLMDNGYKIDVQLPPNKSAINENLDKKINRVRPYKTVDSNVTVPSVPEWLLEKQNKFKQIAQKINSNAQ